MLRMRKKPPEGKPMGTKKFDQPERASQGRKRDGAKAPMTSVQLVEDIKATLISRILQSVEGLSVRQAESETGMVYMTISRMRRGIWGRLEELIEAALNVGVSVDVHIGEARPTVRTDGRQNMIKAPKPRRRYRGKHDR